MESCRLCARPGPRPLWRVKGCTVSHCPACGFWQVDPRPSPEDLAQLYGADYFDHGKYVDDLAWRLEQKRRMAWMIRCGIAPGARVLEAGCGAGHGLGPLKTRYAMWGQDISPQAIAQAKQAHPELAGRLQAGPLEEADFPAASFDAVVMWDVIEHLWDPPAALQTVARLLRPGGRLCLSTPDAGSAMARLAGRRWAFMTPPEHLGFFSRQSMARLLNSAGLELNQWTSRGKWVNAGFMLYKLGRVFPALAKAQPRGSERRGPLDKLVLYAPTGDVAYAGGRLARPVGDES